MSPHPRSGIYYWKCDRPAAFHGTQEKLADSAVMARQLQADVGRVFPGQAVLVRPAAGQGNHRTFLVAVNGVEYFARVDDGPERDDYLEVESHIAGAVRGLGIPAPRVHAVDASRRNVPFAWHLLDRIDCPDLNQLLKQGTLDLPAVATRIGAAVARWQRLEPQGFGPFDPDTLRRDTLLRGFHTTYASYFQAHLERHLCFLTEQGFLSPPEAEAMRQEIARHREYLELAEGCLVHKDLALWNILGTDTDIAAFIDWDDAISGDPMDDLSLLACFHDAPTLARAVAGYVSVKPLPSEHRVRFWLHLLRNMLVKSVIRVGAGYFERSGSFFLIGAGGTGASFRAFTRERLFAALHGLRDDAPLSQLA